MYGKKKMRLNEKPGPKSLHAKAHASVLENLGVLADTRFCCGGVLSPPDNVQVALGLLYSGKVIRFPSEDESSIQELVDACAVASFGVGEKQVYTDMSYRNALKLEPEEFFTSISFQFYGDSSVLGEIKRLLVPQVEDPVRAQLYKLNVYGPGGHFKAHVDTPRGQEMFGSLVVCLPSRFTGGALSVRHQSKEVVFDWSSNPAQKIQWAAFFSDVEHEVLPVADGYRVTLTYNLCHSEKIGSQVASVDPKQSPFYKELAAALGNPHFMREGGVLGFACRHKYVLTDLNSVESSPLLLKGADHNIYAAAKSLGLSACLKPTAFLEENADRLYVLPTFSESVWYIRLGIFDAAYVQDEEVFFRNRFHLDLECTDAITWCWKDMIPSSSTLATVTELNSSKVHRFCQAAAIFVAVPKWSVERASGSFASKDDVWKLIKKKSELLLLICIQ